MDKESALHLVMLMELPRVGDRVAARILERNRARRHSLEAFFLLPPAVLRDEYGLHEDTIQRITFDGAEHEARCQWLLGQLAQAGGQVWFGDDDPYPIALRERLDPSPTILYALGSGDVLAGLKLAVLSSRSVTESSVAATLAVVQAAAAQGFALVGGGMKATYRIAAVAGRAADAARIIVLDRGVFASLGANLGQDPFGFGPGRSALRFECTLVLSPFRPMNHAAPHNGRRRDEVIAALADIIIAVQARPGGEIERVCLEALDRGQCVLSWYGENPGLVAAGASVLEASGLDGLRRCAGR